MRHFALSAVGRDRPGIVAAISQVLHEHGGNVEDSRMSILRGHFTVMLVVSAGDEAAVDRLREDLERVRADLGLEALALSEIEPFESRVETAPTHILSIYGVDHPGILFAVSATLAREQVNITDLTTKLLEGETPLYAMMLEVSIPESRDIAALEEELGKVCAEQNVELSFRELEQDAL
jgi:glycine cleavage system transcriptional repressor